MRRSRYRTPKRDLLVFHPITKEFPTLKGSGKSTLSHALLARHSTFIRLSIDNIIASRHGLYGTDYSPSAYSTYQDEAAALFRSELTTLLAAGERDFILDRSFYAKSDREEFKRLVEEAGGRWVLVFLRVGKEELWKRIEGRRMGVRGPDSAREIEWSLLGEFVEGFEEPVGEGEIVIEN